MDKVLISQIEAKFKNGYNAKIIDVKEAAVGNQGEVYKLTLDAEPFVVALKVINNKELTESEINCIKFISGKVDIGLPKIYFYDTENTPCYIAMQFFEGSNANDKKFLSKSKKAKKAFAEQVVENLLRLQTVKNDKFGGIDNAVYTDWNDFYKPFAHKILSFIHEETKKGNLTDKIYTVMRAAYDRYDDIFDEPVGEPTLTHGDYWAANMMVNENMVLTGIIDPFNVMWADKEYEIFALIPDDNKYGFIKTYKEKVATSKKFDLKSAFYYMFTESYWYFVTRRKFEDFWVKKAKELKKQLKRFGY